MWQARLTDGAVTFQVLQLGPDGRFVDRHRGGQPVGWQDIAAFLDDNLVIPPHATDIFVWVHGWRNDREDQAIALARQVFDRVEGGYRANPARYPRLRSFVGAYILINWPSSSLPTYRGYARVRERAHMMTERGHASRVLAYLLGYLDRYRGGRPARGTLRMPSGQYLHCVGHSFGGRFLAEAIVDAANPVTATLPLLPANPRYQFTVDNLLVFQMAAPADIFGGRLRPLLTDAGLQGPVCLTFSRHDQATCLLHKLAERKPGIGCVGAREPAGMLASVRLRAPGDPYPAAELSKPIVNVDATWRYRRRLPPSGAHSDIGHAESAHLLLTLADLAR